MANKAQPMTAHEIITFRKAVGLSQEQLAEKLGVSQESVSQWENGKKRPSKPVAMLFLRLRQEICDAARNIS